MKKIFGDGGIKGFLVAHCEKIVFGIAVLVFLWIVLPDSGNPPLDEAAEGPDVLKQKATSGTTRLGTDSWPAIYKKRYPQEDRYFDESRADLKRVLVKAYPAPVPLDKPLFPQDKIRTDPKIYPVEELHVAAAYGAVAMKDADARGDDRRGVLADDDDTRPFPPETQRYLEQFGASGVASGAKLESTFIVSVTGLVPVGAQKTEYKDVLGETAGYSQERDTTPAYGRLELGQEDPGRTDYYAVQRAEVASDGSIGEFQERWGPLARSSYKGVFGTFIGNYIQSKWAGDGAGAASGEPDFPDVKHVDPRFAMNVPPLLLRKLPPLANHPKIPTNAAAAEEAEPADGSSDPAFDPLAPGAAPSAAPAAAAPAATRRPPTGFRGGEGGYAGGSATDSEVDILMFRFYDVYAQPGKSYVYRVKLLIEDPNFPLDPTLRPATRNLAPEVIERLNRRADSRVWWRESAFVQSPVIHVPHTQKVLAGPVDPGKVARPANRDFEIRQSEKSAKVMALVWDDAQALDVPGVLESARGSVVNFATDTEAIDPSAGALRKLPEFKFSTENVVLDIRGGEWFTNKKKNAVPGELLLIDADGNLVVHSEVEDAQTFDNHVFPEEAAADDGGILPGVDGGERPPRGRPPRGGDIDLFGS